MPGKGILTSHLANCRNRAEMVASPGIGPAVTLYRRRRATSADSSTECSQRRDVFLRPVGETGRHAERERFGPFQRPRGRPRAIRFDSAAPRVGRGIPGAIEWSTFSRTCCRV